MFDFGALPPEINSARMYSGPGSGPMMAAASGWDALAAQLESYTAGYAGTLAELQGLWSGAASFAMAAAVAPYVAWASATAAHAEQTAGQARAAAAAFEAAFAATVPPPMIAANRIQLAVLVATNFFGQNSAAIAATEAQYAEMWAQDAAAMYGYAAASATATALAPFQQPPQTADPAGQPAQSAAVTRAAGTPAGQTSATVARQLAALPQQLHALATGAAPNTPAAGPATALTSPILTAFTDFNTLSGPLNPAWSTTYAVFSAGHFGTGSTLLSRQLAKGAAVNPAFRAGETSPAAGARGPVLARLGTAAPVGKLSVPPSWVTATATGPTNGPIILEHPGFQAAPAAAGAQPGPTTLGGVPKERSETSGSYVLRNGRRRFQMPRPLYGG